MSSVSKKFGKKFGERMATSRWSSGEWAPLSMEKVEELSLHPASHVLHYGSACFEGLKTHRGVDGHARIFRLDRHVERMRRSAETLCLPIPPSELLTEMILATVQANVHLVPDSPGSLYVRPTLIGTEPNIGGALSPAGEALLFILCSPVGDYFGGGGIRALRATIEREKPRTTPRFGGVKAGANYAMALGVTVEAKRRLGAEQVIFAPGGRIQEAGASNLLLFGPAGVLTPEVDGSFLEGVTRDSILTLARDLGYEVAERPVTVDEVLDWIPKGEIALSGTAAVLAPVGTLFVNGEERSVGDGGVGPITLKLRQALMDVQTARSEDRFGWTRVVEA